MNNSNLIYCSVNPATGELIEEYPSLSDAEVAVLVTNSWSAYQNWRLLSVGERLKYIIRLKLEVEKNAEKLAHMISLEMGKLLRDARTEIKRLVMFCDLALERADSLLASQVIRAPDCNAVGVFEPLGVVLSITPWNVPIATPFRNILPAIVSGNSVILKPAPNVAGCAKLTIDLFRNSGFPDDLVSLALISNSQAERLISDSRIRKIAFTGSMAVGSRLASIAGAHIKPIILELGGSDPCLVLSDVDIQSVAQELAGARCSNAGQVCCSPKRIVIEQSIANSFKDCFVQAMANQNPGDPFSENSTLGPLARKDLLDNLEQQVNKLVKNGASILLDGGVIKGQPGFFFKPMVLEESTTSALSHDEELFGPVAVILCVENAQAAVRVANLSKYGLGATVYTKDLNLAQSISSKLESGFVHINTKPGLHPHVPFGGVKASGYGKDCGDLGFIEYTNYKTLIKPL